MKLFTSSPMYLVMGLLLVGHGDGARAEQFNPHLRTWDLPRKKIIEWDWETSFSSLSYLKAHVGRVEQAPFDGLVITIQEDGKTYKDGLCHEVKWTETEMQPIFEGLAAIEWKAYQHNFIGVFAGEYHLGSDSRERMDWFDDGHWENVLHNIRMMARAAVAGKCVGFLFDPETYHRTVWNYYPNAKRKQPAALYYDTKTYDAYFDQVRRRGAQYMQAIQEEMPQCIFFNAYLAIRIGPSDTSRNINSLYHAFLNGMLDVAGPGIRFVDGNESSYAYKTKADFDRGYTDIRHRKLAYIAPENRRKYNAQVQAAHALFMDEIFGIHQARRWTGTHLSYADRLRLFEQCLVHAMDASDEYIWIYAEKMNWRNQAVPEGAVEVVQRARERVAALAIHKREEDVALNAALSEAMTQRDTINAWTNVSEPLVKAKYARVYPLGRPDDVITLDGELTEAIWEKATVLTDFTHLLYYTRDKVVAPTRARVAWNEEGLYLGFICDGFDAEQFESQPASLRKRNHLRLVISNDASGTTHHRLDFNMDGFAAMSFDEGKTRTWKESAIPEEVPVGVTAIGDGQWTAECFVPWDCIGGRPGPNTVRRANLFRARPSPYEYTSWSPQIEPNLWDVERLGRWQFRGGE